MGYIGQTPTAVPLDGDDLADGIISEAKLGTDAVSLAKMKAGTDGNIISYDASGNPVAIATGNDGQVLTSTGAGSPPAFETLSAGKVLQVVNTQTGSMSTGTTTIPDDASIPQNSEGNEFMTLAITPTSASNKLIIDVALNGAHSATNYNTVALFQDSTANALACCTQSHHAHEPFTTWFRHYMTSGTTSSTTMKVRAGSHAAGTFTINGANASAMKGGTHASSITITEIAV